MAENSSTANSTMSSSDQQIKLKRKFRPVEILIQAFLFVCATLSIATTIGIVYELGKESMTFFLETAWQDTNKPLLSDLSATDTNIRTSVSGRDLREGEYIRIGTAPEIMFVEYAEEGFATVQRGALGTEPQAHKAGVDFYVGYDVTLKEFFTSTSWSPQISQFGILPLVNATLMVTLIGMIVALPIGLSIAIYLSEYASAKARSILKPTMEVLAGIPTVVYGYFALTFVTPILRSIFGSDVVSIYNVASAGIVIGILVTPLISSMAEDALHAVPDSLRQASYAMGATKLETAVKVVVPAAISGIAAAFIVTISRAIGETMVVAIAAGAGPAFTFNPFEAAETMTGHIVRISGGDLSYDSIDYNSIFAIGLVLFVMTFTLNIISQRIVERFREVYE